MPYKDPKKMDAWRLAHYVQEGRYLPPDTPAVLRPYKEPLTAVEEGYGYYGTIAHNEENTHVQCHICGYFYGNLGAHVNKVHKVSADDYREQFQLSRGTGLVSEAIRQKYRENNLHNSEATKEKRLRALQASDRSKAGGVKKSLEAKNKEGRCYYQLLDKIQTLATKLRKVPTKREFIAAYGEGYYGTIRDTFGTWNEALKVLNMTPRNSGGAHRVHYDHESVIDLFREFYEVNGRVPRASDVGQGIIPSKNVIRRLFGGIIGARIAAGFEQADYVHETGDEYTTTALTTEATQGEKEENNAI